MSTFDALVANQEQEQARTDSSEDESVGWSDEEGDDYLAKVLAEDQYLQGEFFVFTHFEFVDTNVFTVVQAEYGSTPSRWVAGKRCTVVVPLDDQTECCHESCSGRV